MKRRLSAFFAGRYGFDTLSKWLLLPSVLLLTVCLFIPSDFLRATLYSVAVINILYTVYRAMSRNIYKRQRENAAFTEFFHIQHLRIKERKTYRYCRCPKCRSWLRVPRGIGEITVKCRVCEHRFDKKT